MPWRPSYARRWNGRFKRWSPSSRYSAKRYASRGNFKRTRYYSKKTSLSAPRINTTNYFFKRTINNENSIFTQVNVTDAMYGGYYVGYGVVVPGLYQATSYAELTALFDSYRINGVEIVFKVNQQIDNTWGSPLELLVAEDFTDDSLPTANELEQRSNTKRYTFDTTTTEVRVFCKPKPLKMIYNGPSSTAYQQDQGKDFISTLNAGVPHYGIKYVVKWPFVTGAPPPAHTLSVYVNWTLYLQMKDPK